MQAALHAKEVSSSQQAAWQLKSIQEATSFMPQAEALAAQLQLNTLLQGLWHPDSSKRLTAQDVAASVWLKNAAAKPMPKAPAIIAGWIK